MNKRHLVTVLGWEDRFIEGFKIILKEYQLNEITLIRFVDYLSMGTMEENEVLFSSLSESHNIKINFLDLEYNDSVANWKNLNDFFLKNYLEKILLNITTIPRETIWALLFHFKKKNKSIEYIYFKPEAYHKGWLTKNHKEPRLLFKHSGVFDLEKKLVLIVITGFDESRLRQLIDYYEPDKLIILSQEGDQFSNSNRNRSMLLKNDDIEISEIEIDSYCISDASKLLAIEIEKNRDFNIILASQGPKTSALSTYNIYLKYKDKLGLAYVPARDFHSHYSKGINRELIKGTFYFNSP
ncbi:hypothetical protein [uncultured Christiangramia sp.]|uniref:hypothetical protein n=1 Tax=uncultured Christiangramia sp. TaxID=503836 RepID=UPI00261E095C|nr:hypothetical protein [uncultured Christiangramia sp.]